MPLPIDAPTDPLTGLSASRFGLYIHFPYCLARCPYCDFAVTVAKPVPHRRYADAVLSELALRLDAVPSLRGKTLDSIFFGGGTPSLWEPQELSRVLDGVSKSLPVSPTAEISLEANPEVADVGRFSDYRRAGINRLSLGVQSFHTPTLKALGRAHDGSQAEAAFRMARSAGFDVVSMDFIYGVSGQTVKDVARDAQQATVLGPDHLSAYALTVDRPLLAEDTVFSKKLARGQMILPPEGDVVDMVQRIEDAYEAAGLLRYEVSNFARKGFHSRHNALYWTGGEYLALGTGATGMWRQGAGAVRSQNERSAQKYMAGIEAGALAESEREELSRHELFEERLCMGLRLRNGVDLPAVFEAFGENFEARQPILKALLDQQLAERREGRWRLTSRGLNLHSEICAKLI